MSKDKQEICVALDNMGKRCRRAAVRVTHYHGDHELYDWKDKMPTWVRVALCDRHSEPKKKRA